MKEKKESKNKLMKELRELREFRSFILCEVGASETVREVINKWEKRKTE